jgi:Holliday junction DNA helicase RuvA
MIGYIEGKIIIKEPRYVIVITSGVGYEVILSKRDLLAVNNTSHQAFFIYTHVRDDAIELYGFLSLPHKQMFELLIGVSGVGPKLALSILADLEPGQILSAIINKDIAVLSSVSGIGKKTGERISLELKEKALKMDHITENIGPLDKRSELDQALRSLGYSKSQSDRALLNLNQQDFDLPFEDLVKKTINMLSGSRT